MMSFLSAGVDIQEKQGKLGSSIVAIMVWNDFSERILDIVIISNKG